MKYFKTIRSKLLSSFKEFSKDKFFLNKRVGIFLGLAIVSSLICMVATAFHYTEKFFANPLTWAGYLVSVIFFVMAFFPSSSRFKSWLKSLNITTVMIFVGIILVYFISHFWNFDTAPWNHNGLFDDSAWNIYFAREYIFTDQPFQAAFFDHNISREVAFHYYISLFFKLFGYNLLVFKIAVVILGLITLLFTALLIQRLFKNHLVTIISALVLNYLPIFFIYNFVGQRYTIAHPLIMSSLYFLYTGFQGNSSFRVVIGSVLTGILLQGSITGKQFLLALLGAILVNVVFNFKKVFERKKIRLGILFIIGVIISSMPLIVYIYYNPVYFYHEKGLTEEFINSVFSGRITYYLTRFWLVFTSSHTYFRRFIPDFLPLPFLYLFLLIPGLILAWIKKRFEIIFLAVIPIVGAFISGADDYRFLHAVPLWIVLMAYMINKIFKLRHKRDNKGRYIKLIILGIYVGLIARGLFSSSEYIYRKSLEPDSTYQFAHDNVSRARFLKEIVSGRNNPTELFMDQELLGHIEPEDDFLICVHRGYAVIHTFLYDYDDVSILDFCGQFPSTMFDKYQLLKFNKEAIANYNFTSKNLQLIWERADETEEIIAEFSEFSYLGSDKDLSFQYKDQVIFFYNLTIKSNNIDEFKQKIVTLKI